MTTSLRVLLNPSNSYAEKFLISKQEPNTRYRTLVHVFDETLTNINKIEDAFDKYVSLHIQNEEILKMQATGREIQFVREGGKVQSLKEYNLEVDGDPFIYIICFKNNEMVDYNRYSLLSVFSNGELKLDNIDFENQFKVYNATVSLPPHNGDVTIDLP